MHNSWINSLCQLVWLIWKLANVSSNLHGKIECLCKSTHWLSFTHSKFSIIVTSSHSGLPQMPYALSYRMRRWQHTNIYQSQDWNIRGIIVVRRRRWHCLEIQLQMTKQRAHWVVRPPTFSNLGELLYQVQAQSVTLSEMLPYSKMQYWPRKIQPSTQDSLISSLRNCSRQ